MKKHIRVTQSGLTDSEGKQIPVGTEFDVVDVPAEWEGKYCIISREEALIEESLQEDSDIEPGSE
jgi:hypothetical protein